MTPPQWHQCGQNMGAIVSGRLHQAGICQAMVSPGPHPTNVISIQLEILWKFSMLWFKMCLIDHKNILHTSRQCYCRDVCKISLWSAEYIMNKNIARFNWILNLIEISLVGQATGLACKPQNACSNNFILVDPLGPQQNSCHFADDIFKCTFSWVKKHISHISNKISYFT